MRLLNVRTLAFKQFSPENVPPYVIASHRWCNDETSFADFRQDWERKSEGYKKVDGLCAFMRSRRQDISWVWIDSCCIDKRNQTELSKAINSMFRWYRNAVECYAYLSDVNSSDELGKSEWFERGWTLQELLASTRVVFLTKEW